MICIDKHEKKQIKNLKLKKNVKLEIDIERESIKDPKYKTELCKSFETTGNCVYSNKCRFAHGKHELILKSQILQNYKIKKCISFHKLGYCAYGKRCHFLHHEKNIHEIKRSYFSFLLAIYTNTITDENTNLHINVDSNTKIDILSNGNSPKTPQKMTSPINLSNFSTESSDSFKSIYSHHNILFSKCRLKIFIELHLLSVKRDLSDSFSVFKNLGFPINCKYQTLIHGIA